ncbi:MAG: hypothetical protein AAF587_29275 [Bacteroidota bacterium]
MNNRILLLCSFCLIIFCSYGTDSNAQTYSSYPNRAYSQQKRTVIVNDQRVPESTLQAFERQYGIQILSGKYWYDARAGLWGYIGGPTVGYILPNMNLGGKLKYNASGAMTNVVINGRSIHMQELRYLQSLGPVYAGRYWLDAYGNYGLEGGPMMGNLVQAAQYAQGRGRRNGGGSSFFRNGYTGVGGGSDGTTSYVIGKDFSVIVD